MLLGATDGLQAIVEQTAVESWGIFLLGGLRLQLTWSTLFKNYFFGAIMQGKCVPGVMLIGLRTLGIILILWFPGCRGSQR